MNARSPTLVGTGRKSRPKAKSFNYIGNLQGLFGSLNVTQVFLSVPIRRNGELLVLGMHHSFLQSTKVMRWLVALSLLAAPQVCLYGQKTGSTRKVVHKVDPKYPPNLRKNGVGGIVRLLIVIAPRGTVEKVSPVGGNAALVEVSTNAVKQWKYVPAERPTTTEVQFDFIPSH